MGTLYLIERDGIRYWNWSKASDPDEGRSSCLQGRVDCTESDARSIGAVWYDIPSVSADDLIRAYFYNRRF